VGVYSELSREELVEEFDSVASALCGSILELAEVKVSYAYYYNLGYQNTHETSVSGRARSGEIAAQSMAEDEVRLQASVDSLRVLMDCLAKLLDYRRAD
jgi:hypothetical protein